VRRGEKAVEHTTRIKQSGQSLRRAVAARLRSSRRGRVARLAAAAFSHTPLQVAYYDDRAMRRRIESLADPAHPFDAVVCHLIRMAPLAERVPARVRVLYLCDSIGLGLTRRLSHAPLLERPSIWLESGRVRRYESAILRGFDEGWLVSEPDREAFPADQDKLRIVHHGVDESLRRGEIPRDTPPVVGFLGHLAVPHNVDAAGFLVEKVLPRLRDRGLDATVRLYGAEPAPRVRRLIERPHVEWAGYVPDLGAALRSMRVFCAPIRFSSGVQNKLLEALAAGVPVITSEEAARAVGSEALRWIRVAGDADAYAHAVVDAWQRSEENVRELEAAREWTYTRFRWENYADRLDDLLARNPASERSATARSA
jgi:glycosyltransferase involved in cell wall biosynthesis